MSFKFQIIHWVKTKKIVFWWSSYWNSPEVYFKLIFHRLYHSRNSKVSRGSPQKFQAKIQPLKWFTQPIHFVTHGFTVLAVLTFVSFSDNNSLNLNPNDLILDSKHIYTKFPTNMGKPYNFSLTRNTPEIGSKFQTDFSLTIVLISSTTKSLS